MSRTFITKGRADPWRTHYPKRPVTLDRREAIPSWAWWLVAAVVSPFVAGFVSWAGQL